jgi:hypothetical protein
MAKTAIGLFENPGSVDEVVRDLEASAFPRKDVRVLGESREMAGSGLMSTPHTDFEVGLIRDLTVFGVLEADAEDYVQGVRRGGVMVFATSSGDKAQAATEIINRHGAVEIEKISASQPDFRPRTTVRPLTSAILLSKLEGPAPPALALVCSCGSSFTKDKRTRNHG